MSLEDQRDKEERVFTPALNINNSCGNLSTADRKCDFAGSKRDKMKLLANKTRKRTAEAMDTATICNQTASVFIKGPSAKKARAGEDKGPDKYCHFCQVNSTFCTFSGLVI